MRPQSSVSAIRSPLYSHNWRPMLCLPLLLEYASKQERMFSWKDAALATPKVFSEYAKHHKAQSCPKAPPVLHCHLFDNWTWYWFTGVLSCLSCFFLFSCCHLNTKTDCYERIVTNGLLWTDWSDRILALGFCKDSLSLFFASKASKNCGFQMLCKSTWLMGLLEQVAKDKRQKVATK